MNRPAALAPGARLRVVALASPPDPVRLRRGVRRLEQAGFRVSLADGARRLRVRGDLAGTDEERARDLEAAFLDPDVDGIVCSNGGFGSLRILPLVDWDAVARHPKVFVGYSDITAVHGVLNGRGRMVTFHGPMASPEEREALDDRFSREALLRAVTSTRPLGALATPPRGQTLQVVAEGRGSGPLAGGNLSLVAATVGTPYEIDTAGKILLLEDWNEPPFTIETLLLQLRLAGKLDDVAGVVLGEFPNCHASGPGFNRTVQEVVQDVFADLDAPVLYGFAAGHARAMVTLPLGARATIDTAVPELRVDEAATVARARTAGAAARPHRARAREGADEDGAAERSA